MSTQSTQGCKCTQLTLGSAEMGEGKKQKHTDCHLSLKAPRVNICDVGRGHFDIL